MNWVKSLASVLVLSLVFIGLAEGASRKWTAKVYLKVEPGRDGREKIRLYTPGDDGEYVGHDGQGIQVCDNETWERTCEWSVPVVNNQRHKFHMTFRLNKSGKLLERGSAHQLTVTQGQKRLASKERKIDGACGPEIEVTVGPK